MFFRFATRVLLIRGGEIDFDVDNSKESKFGQAILLSFYDIDFSVCDFSIFRSHRLASSFFCKRK
jgi:hypothetical protein